MIRSLTTRKEILASAVLEETQGHGSTFSERQCCCRFNVHGSRKAAPSRDGPLQDQGDVISAQESTGMF